MRLNRENGKYFNHGDDVLDVLQIGLVVQSCISAYPGSRFKPPY